MEQSGGQEVPKNPRKKIWGRISHAVQNLLPNKRDNKTRQINVQKNDEARFPDPNDYYKELVGRESIPPDPNEIIHAHGFTDTPKDQEDLQRLIDAGLPEDAVRGGKICRRDLISAGLVFNNRIGAGEKPILSGVIVIDGQEVDLTARRFLTQAELDAVIKQQKQAHLDFPKPGTSGMEDLRKDMLRFLIEGTELVTHEHQIGLHAGQDVLSNLLTSGMITQEQLLKYLGPEGYIAGIKEEYRRRLMYGSLLDESVALLNLVKLRGIPVTGTGSIRFNKLRGDPSPFLDSGFHFDDNWDLTLNDNDGEHTRRINMVVWHLMSRGLGEMGNSLNGSHDQTYMTGPEYMRDVFPKRTEKESVGILTDDDKKLIALRIRRRVAPDTVSKKKLQ